MTRGLTSFGRWVLLLGGLASACAGGSRVKGDLQPLDDVSLEQVDRALGGKRLALLVGINHFEDGRWPVLKHATDDATALGALLTDPDRGRFDAVEVLADPGGTTRAQILAALERLAAQNTSAADTVVIYFSTHGTLARGPDGELARYLVTSDANEDRIPASALRVGELLARFEALPSTRKLLVLAACHSGAGKSALPPKVAAELSGTKGAFFVKPLAETSQASMVLTACAWGETAREDDGLGHDIYTAFLLEALTGEDADSDGAVTATEAHAHAMARTYYFSQGRQRPQVESRVLGIDPIVLAGRRVRPGDPVLYSFLPRFAGLKVQVDGRDKGELPARLVLPAGAHRVVVCEPGSCGGPGQAAAPLVDEQVELSPGESLAVEDLFERSEPNWNLTVRAGYQQFLDARTRAELVGPLATLGLAGTWFGFPFEAAETSIDLSFGGGRQDVDTGGELRVEQDVLQIAYGLQVLFGWQIGSATVLIGPRVAGLHILRLGFNPDGTNQRFANFTPGMVAGLRWQFDPGLTLGLEARLQYLSIHTLDQPRNTGFIDLMAGLGWSF